MAENALQMVVAELEGLSAVEDIRLLRARYARCVDMHEWDAWRTLLTEDYRLETELGVQDGRETIVAFVSSALGAASTVHQVFAPEITITGPKTATGRWAFEERIVFPAEPKPVVLHGFGYLEDEYVHSDDGWRIRSTIETKLQTSEA